MGKGPAIFASILIFSLMIAACTSDPMAASGPRLVQEATRRVTDVLPTREPSSTPVVIPVSTSEPVASAAVSTVEGEFPDFVLLTPTLPPSKTPTPTATITPTATDTPPPTATPQAPIFPTYLLATSAAVTPAAPLVSPQVCDQNWFFSQPISSTCPQGDPLESAAVYLQFQHGFMIWVAQQDAIYTFYDSVHAPRWQVFKDMYEESTPERDPSLSPLAPAYTWQPRRGFGSVWRDNDTLRDRIGWAVAEWEEQFTIQIQLGADGTIFLADPHGGIIVMQPGGRDWDRYILP